MSLIILVIDHQILLASHAGIHITDYVRIVQLIFQIQIIIYNHYCPVKAGKSVFEIVET